MREISIFRRFSINYYYYMFSYFKSISLLHFGNFPRMFPRDDVLDPGCLKAAEAATMEGCLSLHRESISRVFPLGLVYGNTSPDDARRIWRMVRGHGTYGEQGNGNLLVVVL